MSFTVLGRQASHFPIVILFSWQQPGPMFKDPTWCGASVCAWRSTWWYCQFADEPSVAKGGSAFASWQAYALFGKSFGKAAVAKSNGRKKVVRNSNVGSKRNHRLDWTLKTDREPKERPLLWNLAAWIYFWMIIASQSIPHTDNQSLCHCIHQGEHRRLSIAVVEAQSPRIRIILLSQIHHAHPTSIVVL